MTGRREFVAGLVLGCAVGTVGTGLLMSAPEDDESPTEDATPTEEGGEIERMVKERVNEEREAEHGGLVPDLRTRERLADMAAYHAKNMANNGYVGHVNSEDVDVFGRYQQFGLVGELREGRPRRLIEEVGAENVASVDASGLDAEEIAGAVVDAWMEDHREWLLEQSWSEHGVGVARADDVVYATQNYL